jgi:aminoglycoside 6-adenylyltransferase
MPAAADDVLDRLTAWAAADPNIRALILEGSRANPRSRIDAYSDYDVAIVVADRAPFDESDAWERWLGEPLIHWGDSGDDDGIVRTMRLVIYESGTRIDYCILTPDALARMKALGRLPPIFDTGYRVLLDKDGITAGLPAATHDTHVPRPPDAAEFARWIDDFWIDAAYVAKSLCRGERLPAKHGLSLLVLWHLRRLLEWRAAVDDGWTLPAGRHGRGLQARVSPERWKQLEATFSGADVAADWRALWQALDLHRELAGEVASALGFDYPHQRDAGVTSYLRALSQAVE